MKNKVTVFVEIEFNPKHPDVSGMTAEYVDAIAKDMAFGSAATNIQSGVKLLSVTSKEEDACWYTLK